jgi:MYXO-CTERM domain-containing protein
LDAAIVPITSNTALSTEGLGAFVGTLNYTFLGGTTGTLDVTLTNTTDASIGGYLTAFMFRPPPELGAFGCSLTSSSVAAMTNIPAGSGGSPFPGSWIGGAGTGGSWLAGGAPGGAIGVGQTGMFSFTITGANASMLSSDAFVSGSLVSDPYAFIVRFRGMENGGSDKVPANELPAPGAIALLSLAGLGQGRRRRDGA